MCFFCERILRNFFADLSTNGKKCYYNFFSSLKVDSSKAFYKTAVDHIIYGTQVSKVSAREKVYWCRKHLSFSFLALFITVIIGPECFRLVFFFCWLCSKSTRKFMKATLIRVGHYTFQGIRAAQQQQQFSQQSHHQPYFWSQLQFQAFSILNEKRDTLFQRTRF